MYPMKRLATTAVAVFAVTVSACGAPEEGPTSAEESSQSEAPSASASPSAEETPSASASASETSSPTAELPFEEGPVDPAEFGALYAEAYEDVDHVMWVLTAPMGETMTFYVERDGDTDAVAYSTIEADGKLNERVMRDGTMWVREDGGEWEDITGDSEIPDTFDTLTVPTFTDVELVSKAQREFYVTIENTDAEPYEATLTIDEDFRPITMISEFEDLRSTTEYDFESTLEIPETPQS